MLRGHTGVELNIEGNPFHGLLEHVGRVRPSQCTLVPDETTQSTSDHGWDLEKDGKRLAPVIERVRALGCRASVFIDARAEAVTCAHDLGADRVELYTEPYATAFARGEGDDALVPFVRAAEEARELGIGVNAGHDLNRTNLAPFLARVPDVLEVSIGHALVADALEFGLDATVRKYLAVIAAACPSIRVLFVCWHNAARSQIAAALLAKHPGFVVTSAGTHASTSIHPMVLEIMRELDVDLSSARPRQLTDELVRDADVVIRCLAPDPDDHPWPAHTATFLDWSVPMPANEHEPTITELRVLRDALAAHVDEFVRQPR